MVNYSEILANYREARINEAALILQLKPHLCELAIAWTKTHKESFKPSPGLMTLSDLWKSTKIDYEALEAVTNLTTLQILKGIEQLKIINVILPDGTLNKTAQAIINNKILANIKLPALPEGK